MVLVRSAQIRLPPLQLGGKGMETLETRSLSGFCLLAAEATYSKLRPEHRRRNENGLSKRSGVGDTRRVRVS